MFALPHLPAQLNLNELHTMTVSVKHLSHHVAVAFCHPVADRSLTPLMTGIVLACLSTPLWSQPVLNTPAGVDTVASTDPDPAAAALRNGFAQTLTPRVKRATGKQKELYTPI